MVLLSPQSRADPSTIHKNTLQQPTSLKIRTTFGESKTKRDFTLPAPTLLNNLQLPQPSPRKSVLPLLPQPQQLLGVLGVDAVDVRGVRVLVLHDLDGPADDDVDGAAVGHEAYVVIEDACRTFKVSLVHSISFLSFFIFSGNSPLA